MSNYLQNLGRGLLETIFPPLCASCPDMGREPFCRLCAEALEPADSFEIEGATASRALLAYGGPAALAVQALKYQDRPELGPGLGKSMALLLRELPAVEVAVPVPLSSARLTERGYNQARELCRGLPLNVLPQALIRRPGMTPQVGLDREARISNLLKAFSAGLQSVEGLRVLLVDDVVTTGATAQACAQALRDAGASEVVVLSLCRAA